MACGKLKKTGIKSGEMGNKPGINGETCEVLSQVSLRASEWPNNGLKSALRIQTFGFVVVDSERAHVGRLHRLLGGDGSPQVPRLMASGAVVERRRKIDDVVYQGLCQMLAEPDRWWGVKSETRFRRDSGVWSIRACECTLSVVLVVSGVDQGGGCCRQMPGV